VLLGSGRVIQEPTRNMQKIRAVPWCGAWLERKLWKPCPITNDTADNGHIVTVATSGKGKTLGVALPLFEQAVQKGGGIVLDGVGTLSRYCLRQAIALKIPPERFFYWEPGKYTEFGTPLFHWLGARPDQTQEEVVEELVSDVVEVSERRQASGFRQADFSRHGFRLLQLADEPLVNFPRLLSSTYRQNILKRVSDLWTLEWWHDFGKNLRPDQQRTWAESSLNRFGGMSFLPMVASAIAHTRSTVDFFTSIQRGDVLVMNLGESRMKQEIATTWGQMTISKLKSAIMQRESIPEKDRIPLTLICDEYSLFHTPATLRLFRMARNMGVSLILLMQEFDFIPEPDLRAILGSAGTVIAMGCGAKEGERLVHELFDLGTPRRRAWADDHYFTPNELYYGGLTRVMSQEQRQTVTKVRPTGLYYMMTPYRDRPVEHPEAERWYMEQVADHWYYRP
jgi:hypothetical protein